jgi:signal transduction histidine kinase
MASVGYLMDDIARDAPPDVGERLAGLRQHLTGLVSELRLSIFDLRAGVDETVGLTGTLSDYVTRVGQQAGLVVHVTSDGSLHRLPVATEIELLRIVQEAVTNVRKHAGASNLWLEVSVDPPRARVTVKDDGHGLGRRRPESMGITGMKERARRIGAGLSVRNRADGRGTVVEVVIDPENLPARLGVSGGVATAELPTVGDSGSHRA